MGDQKAKAPNNNYSSTLQSIEPALIEDEALNSNERAETIDQSFVCCICLDLLYKPIVLACGHISCFWCVHRAMNGIGKSYCPLCRCPYHHFPSICQLLHFLLLKLYPVAYMMREKQVLEEEKNSGFFSPQFDELTGFHPCKELNVPVSPSISSTTSSQNGTNADTCPTENTCSLNVVGLLDGDTKTVYEENCAGNFEVDRNKAVEEVELKVLDGDLKDKVHVLVSINDVLCIACGELLFQPVVLNCGHVYCKSCIATQVDEKLRCQLCQSLDPKGLLKVCLELDHFLKEHFPNEYALRREAVHLQGIHCQQSATQHGICSAKPTSPTKSYLSWFSDLGPNIHFGAGCDYCGMCPIVGERYQCKDCVEAIGFDLCGECYNSRSKRPGRFNQQHRPEHKFELVRAQFLRNIMLRLASDTSEDGSAVPILSDDASEDLEDSHAAHSIADDALENPENTNSTI